MPPIDPAKLPRILTPEQDNARRDSVRVADSTRRARLQALPPEQRAAVRDSIRHVRDSLNIARGQTPGISQNERDKMNEAVADSIDRGLNPKGAQLIARGGSPCDSSGVSTRYMRRFAARMPVMVRVPCNINTLVKSPDLPLSIYASGEDVFSTKDRDALMKEA